MKEQIHIQTVPDGQGKDRPSQPWVLAFLGEPAAPPPGRGSEPDQVAAPPPDVSGRLIETMLNTRTWCRATDRTISGYAWAGTLGLVTALIGAVTALEVFTNLEANQTSTAARVVVGMVLILTALVGALQSWTGQRTKSLGAQMAALHQLHRDIAAVIEKRAATPITDADVDAFERRLSDMRGGTWINVSERRFQAARQDIENEITWLNDPRIHEGLNNAASAVGNPKA